MLVEAFPAAQLHAWGLPDRGYSKPDQRNVRELILSRLRERLSFSASQETLTLGSPDALDAVIAAFAAVGANATGKLANHPDDGLIAVLDDVGRHR